MKALFFAVSIIFLEILSASLSTNSVLAADKNFALSLPLVTLGREGTMRGEYNIASKATVAVEWVEWLGANKREEMSSREIEENPGTSMLTKGRDISLVFGRYSRPGNMSGFNWGLGLGYRELAVNWIKGPAKDQVGDDLVVDESGKLHHNLNVKGTTFSGRIGYRYVAKVGVMLGACLGLKHFQNSIQDNKDSDDPYKSSVANSDRISLSRRFTSALKVGVELGWVF